MNTAKTNFKKFAYNNQVIYEATKEQCKQKINTLESCKVSFAIGWTIFWSIFFILSMGSAGSVIFLFGIISFSCALFLNISNYSKRKNYKDVQLMRLQMKITKFEKYEIVQKQQLEVSIPNENKIQLGKKEDLEQEIIPVSAPLNRQLDFSNLAKEKVIQILELSNISYLKKDTHYELSEKINNNEIAWNKIPEILLKEVLDINGITYKLNINKDDMVKLLK